MLLLRINMDKYFLNWPAHKLVITTVYDPPTITKQYSTTESIKWGKFNKFRRVARYGVIDSQWHPVEEAILEEYESLSSWNNPLTQKLPNAEIFRNIDTSNHEDRMCIKYKTAIIELFKFC